MKSLFLVVLLAVAASAAVVSNVVPSVVKVPEGDDGEDVDVNDMPEVVVTTVNKLTDVAELTDEADVPAQTAVAIRRDLNLGYIAFGDVLVSNNEISTNGVANLYLESVITVSSNRRLSAIRVNHVGLSQNATPSILIGGIGSYSVTIKIRSARGSGYHYRIQVYAR